MSEQMFGIKVNGGIVDAAPSADEATDKAIIFYSRHHQHPWQIVPVRIVEDAEPCDWERIILNNPNDVTPGKYKPTDGVNR